VRARFSLISLWLPATQRRGCPAKCLRICASSHRSSRELPKDASHRNSPLLVSLSQGGGGGLIVGAGTVLALFEPVAVAIHLEDMNVVGKAVSSTPVKRSEAKTLVHSSKGRLLVTMIEPRS